MDLENQRRVKEIAEKLGTENLVVVLGGAEAEASGLAAETVISGDPAYAGPLTGVQLGLEVYHIFELKSSVDAKVYEEQVSMMELVLDMDAIIAELNKIRSSAAAAKTG